jgi:predicted metal-dependent enzyme (double-stranded beta helix superfamily)
MHPALNRVVSVANNQVVQVSANGSARSAAIHVDHDDLMVRVIFVMEEGVTL